MKALVEKLRAGIDLSPEDISYSVAVLLSSTASDDLKAEFLTALHRKGESAEENEPFHGDLSFLSCRSLREACARKL